MQVIDSGIGIPAQKMRLIFDPFSQADGSTTRQFGGTGLGLTISQNLAALMNGRISVDSVGRSEKDGSLLLQQSIHEPGKPPRVRYWRLRQTGPDRFDGTLTDAAGPVRVDLSGDRLRIRYKGKDNLDFEQWLTPAGPKQVNNRMRVKRFGIVVAHFNEVIRKLD